MKRVDGVTTNVRQPSADLSNRTPQLQVSWDTAKLKLSGQDVSRILLDTEPRIQVAGAGPSSVSIVPYQMIAGEEKVVADRLHAILSKPPKIDPPPVPTGEPATVTGQWDLKIDFVYGSANHSLILEQEGGTLKGTHRGEFAAGDLAGTVAAKTLRFQSSIPTEGSRVSFQFTGNVVDGGKMSGTVGLGEYGEAKWTAERHQYRGGGRRG